MKTSRVLAPRVLGGSAVLGILLAGGLAIGSPALAQEKEGARREFRNVIVKRDGKDGKPVVIEGRELSEFKAKCEKANKAESEVSSGSGDKKYFHKIVVCGDEGETPAEVRAELLKALEKARTELGSRDRIPAEHRADALAALEREIARVRAQSN